MFIPLILSTARKDRESEKVARYLFSKMKTFPFETEYIDIKDFLFGHTIPSWEKTPETDRWKEIVKKSDAIIFVVPEYNHGYPGEFKILLDSALKEYDKKPVGIASVSNGNFGGARMADFAILPVFRKMGAVIISKTLYFGNVETLFDASGNITDPKYEERVEAFVKELAWFAQTMRYGKEHVSF